VDTSVIGSQDDSIVAGNSIYAGGSALGGAVMANEHLNQADRC
jgi:hypothetical protein